ncbi:hypothetical protein ElyMa_000435200 [Elysia marginata]|uniref:Uncharacterized protein n=1 Tax=Elysia marginata TaxID=1093978 RepID=A0AAV4FP01_9GAST|nr:hypothetical protein ElyMa_000435200 [Elysia marginata]
MQTASGCSQQPQSSVCPACWTSAFAYIRAVFGPGGLTSSPTIVVFEERLTNIQTTINDQAPAYLQHFTSRVLPILQQNLDTMLTRTEASHDWTNNNCESMNHILKMKKDWRPQAIPQLIDSIHEIAKGHYTDVERAIMGQPAVWCTKTDEQRRRHMEKFERALKIKRSMATSCDGDIYVLTSGVRGKTIGQKKRVKASRTGRL